jgi:hypothetical protein
MYFRHKTSAERSYLQIAENRRDDDRVCCPVTATLGRCEELQASGRLVQLLQSVRFAATAMVLAAGSLAGWLGDRRRQ